MSPIGIIELAEDDGVQLALSPSGGITVKGQQSAIDRWLPTIRQNRTPIILRFQIESRRDWVLATLRENPGIRYAIEVIDPDTDPVVICIGIRSIATFEIKVPQARYDPFVLLELLEKHPLWRTSQ